MAGFGLDGFFGRVPCPHGKSTDCCGIRGTREERQLICCYKGKVMTVEQLEKALVEPT